MDGYYFRSDLFHVIPGEDEETNPCLYGKMLAMWLRGRFRERGYLEAECFAEDWGWCVMCRRGDCLLWVGCGGVDFGAGETADELPAAEEITWHVFAQAEVPFYHVRGLFRRLTGRLKVQAEQDLLAAQLGEILSQEPGIRLCDEP